MTSTAALEIVKSLSCLYCNSPVHIDVEFDKQLQAAPKGLLDIHCPNCKLRLTARYWKQVPQAIFGGMECYDESYDLLHLLTFKHFFRFHGHNFIISVCSCPCGGDLAWSHVEDVNKLVMIGCVCHHSPMEIVSGVGHFNDDNIR